MTNAPRVKRHPEETVLWEGPCAYVVKTRECYEVIVFSTNCVTHKPAGITESGDRAESVCRRLNAYPRQTRHAYGLL